MVYLKKSQNKIISRVLCVLLILQFLSSPIAIADTTTVADSDKNVSYTIVGSPRVGNEIEIVVNVSNVTDLYGGSVDFVYDTSLLEIQSIQKGSIFGDLGIQMPVKKIEGGQVNAAIMLSGNRKGVTGSGSLLIIKAKVLKEGTINIKTISSNNSITLGGSTCRVKLSDSNGQAISYNAKDISVDSSTNILIAGKYEETNSAIKYVGNWQNDSNSSHSGGTVKYAVDQGSYFEFTFNGTGFEWAQPVNSNRGIAKVSIDGVPVEVDTYSSTQVYKKVVYSQKDLLPGEHKVKVEVTNNKNNKATAITQTIDYIEVFGQPGLTAGKYEEDHYAIKYSGDWQVDPNSSHSGGTVKYSVDAGSYFEFTFNGTGFEWAQPVNANRGIAKVTIDGDSVNVDTYSSLQIYQNVVYVKNGLEPGKHTVRIEVTDSKNSKATAATQTIDYINILDTPVLTEGKHEEDTQGILYSNGWYDDPNGSHSGGNVKYAVDSGSYFEFAFNGTGFEWVQPVNSKRGIAKVTVDGVPVSVDTYSSTQIYQKVVYSKQGLTLGHHSVKVEVTNSKNNNADTITQTLDYIQIFNTPQEENEVLSVGKYEEDYRGIKYFGNWGIDPDKSHSNGSVKYAVDAGSSFEFYFEGTGFEWVQPVNAKRGIAQISIDDKIFDVDTYNSSQVYQKSVYSVDGLQPGKHKVRVEVTNKKSSNASTITQSIDYIKIFNSSDAVPILEEGLYEENSPGIKYSGDWGIDPDKSHSSGNVNYAVNPGSYFEFTFYGTGFEWVQPVNTKRGIAKVTVDGVETNVDTYSTKQVYQKEVYSKNELPIGNHKVKIEVTNLKNNNATAVTQTLDYIKVFNDSKLTTEKFEENDSRIKYVGSWGIDSDVSHSGGTVNYAVNSGSYFEFTFNGTGFDWVQPVNVKRGIAKVTIDGVSIDIDCYSPSQVYKKVAYSKRGLKEGNHTVRVEVTNSKNKNAATITQTLDYIKIYK